MPMMKNAETVELGVSGVKSKLISLGRTLLEFYLEVAAPASGQHTIS